MSVLTPRLPRHAATLVSASVATLLFGTACGLADIRPDTVVDSISATEASEGRALLSALLQRHGGAGYCTEGAARAVLSDDWGLFSFAGPWPKGVDLMQLQWNPCHDTGRVTYLDGPDRLSGIGIQNWETYAVDAKGEVTFKEIPDAAFMIPALAYFLELPFRIGDADIVGAAGTELVDGRPHHVVFATFGAALPDTSTDQYLLYIDAESGLLTRADYTVREAGESMSGTAIFRAHQRTGDYVLPHDVELTMQGGRATLHHMRLRGAIIGPDVVAADTLYPDATRSRKKGAPPSPTPPGEPDGAAGTQPQAEAASPAASSEVEEADGGATDIDVPKSEEKPATTTPAKDDVEASTDAPDQ